MKQRSIGVFQQMVLMGISIVFDVRKSEEKVEQPRLLAMEDGGFAIHIDFKESHRADNSFMREDFGKGVEIFNGGNHSVSREQVMNWSGAGS